MPDDQVSILKAQDDKLNEIINEFGGNYQGTDPIKDRMRIYEQQSAKALKMKKNKETGRYEIKSQQEIKEDLEEFSPFDKFGPGIKAYF